MSGSGLIYLVLLRVEMHTWSSDWKRVIIIIIIIIMVYRQVSRQPYAHFHIVFSQIYLALGSKPSAAF
jgi:hypothetical protein